MPRLLLVCLALTCCAAAHPVDERETPPIPSAASRASGKTLLELLIGGSPETPETCPAAGLVKLTDAIDDDLSAKIIKQLDACNGRTVTIEINSPGSTEKLTSSSATDLSGYIFETRS